MKICVISFTERGKHLANRIKEIMQGSEVMLYQKPEEGLEAWTGRQFAEKNALLFIGACGIAVRTIAPYLKDKFTDPPVLVLDERGSYVIPVLSGHMGGANELAEFLAERLGAQAVITTATDINGKFAVDLFAKKNNMMILDREGVAKISAKALREEKITIAVEEEDNGAVGKELPEGLERVPYPPRQKADILISSGADNPQSKEQAVLRLLPREYVLGIGCRRGRSEAEIDAFIMRNLAKAGIALSAVAAVASIDRKRDEPGICQWVQKTGVPFVVFSEERLRQMEGDFCSSAFVERAVGVDNVCERAAMAACAEGGVLILPKQAENGITLAIAKQKRPIRWEW